MQQFYFLSVVANILAGATLCGQFFADKFPSFRDTQEKLSRPGTRLGIGIVAVVVGFFKLFIRSSLSDVRVVGDLFPALAGMAMGAVLVLEYMGDRAEENELGASGEEEHWALKARTVAERYRVPLGLSGIVIGVLHFFIPGAIIF